MAPDEHHDHDHDHHEHSYQAAIGGYRAEKDEFFKTSPHSPIPEEERAAFDALPYYPINENLVVEGLRLSRMRAASRRASRSRPRTASCGRLRAPGRSASISSGARDA